MAGGKKKEKKDEKACLMFENAYVICKYAKCSIHSLWRETTFRIDSLCILQSSSLAPPRASLPPRKVSLCCCDTMLLHTELLQLLHYKAVARTSIKSHLECVDFVFKQTNSSYTMKSRAWRMFY